MAVEPRALGKLGEAVLPLGLGCAAIGGYYTSDGRVASRGGVSDDETRRAIDVALDGGIRLFDVANIYGAGHAERVLGRSLSGRRDRAILQVKFGASFDEVTRSQIDYDDLITETMIRNSVEASLRRLQTDYIDILQFQIDSYPMDRLPDVVGVCEALVSEGAIRAYSYGAGEIDRVRPFVEGAHCATVITNHNVVMEQAELADYLGGHGVALLAGLPLFLGLLSGRYGSSSVFEADDVRAALIESPGVAAMLPRIESIRHVLADHGRTMAEGALAWLWARHSITIPVPGFRSVANVQSSLRALEHGPLSTEEMAAIAAVLAQPDSELTDRDSVEDSPE